MLIGTVVTGAAAPASAQDPIKPKVLIVFDTSGSMLNDESKDGSALCGGVGKESRIFQLKQALFDVLQGIGADEMDFALATFPEMFDASTAATCPYGHYFTVASQNSEIPEYNQCPDPPYFGACRRGCKVSQHQPVTQNTANCKSGGCPWYSSYKSEALRVTFGEPVEKVMYWFDNVEDPAQDNPEVRAFRWTPLGKSLFYAHGYFHKEVALPANDYRKKCERLVVALFTDGEETCNDTSVDSFYPTKWAKKLNDNLGVVTHTVAIDISDQLLNDIATSGKGTYYQVGGNTSALKVAFLDIISKSLIPAEICNGEDDDCDNQIDEDFPRKNQPCNNGKLGVCFRQGIYVCKADGSGVVCNAKDAQGTAEICNGLDDDCDGQIDEIPGCIPCAAQPEVCNGKDDDCDGQIDEDIPPSPCGKAVGECQPGTTICINGQTVCQGGTGPGAEVCDGKDNDCDGVRDGLAEPCYSFATGCDLQTGVCQGQCRLGTRFCKAQQSGTQWIGQWSLCTGEVGPDKDICDGLDNDCDGVLDEDAECPGGSQCVEGECTKPCSSGEFVCPEGQICKNGWCITDRCKRDQCEASGGVCKAGECINLCDQVTCGKFEQCSKGVCVDHSCYQAFPCPAGNRCVQGSCVPDGCAGKTCGLDEFCHAGRCVPTCEALGCGSDQRCQLVDTGPGGRTTQCVDDPCAGVVCSSGSQICVQGQCLVDPCESVECDKNQVCVAGTCLPDPCEYTRCRSTHQCEAGLCVSRATSTTKTLATGGGGVACSLSADDAGAPGLLWLVGLWLLVRRRRRRA